MPRKRSPDLKVVPTVKPDLVVHPDHAAVAVGALRYLAENADEVFRFQGELAFVKRDDHGVPMIRKLKPHDVRMLVRDHMQPVQYGRPKKSDGPTRKEVSLPEDVAKLMLAATTDLQDFRRIVAVTATPLLRGDGSIRKADGYDEQAQVLCDFAALPAFELLEHPTKEDAKKALREIRTMFCETPFADRVCCQDKPEQTDLDEPPGRDESAFLNGLLLGVCRPSMGNALGIVIRATSLSGAASGKTTVAHALGYTAFGADPGDTPFGQSMEAFDKILGSVLRDGRVIVVFDNGNDLTLRSNLLAMILTSGNAEDRTLGKSEMGRIASRALLIFTGNALSISEDDVRRLIVTDLDPRTEDPERRAMSNRNFLQDVVIPRRAALLSNLLTVWRWGRQNQDQIKSGETLANFDVYCRWVRDPLLALGCSDPVNRIDELKGSDPEREHLAEVFSKWWEKHPSAKSPGKETIPVTAHGLHPDVSVIIDVNYAKNARKGVISALAKWRGTRTAGFLLNHDAGKKAKWSPTKYWLTKTEEKKKAEQQEQQKPQPTQQEDSEASDKTNASTPDPTEDDDDDDEASYWASEASQRNSTDCRREAEQAASGGPFKYFGTHPDDICDHCGQKGDDKRPVYRLCLQTEIEHHLLHDACAAAFYAREEEIADGWASSYEDGGDAG